MGMTEPPTSFRSRREIAQCFKTESARCNSARKCCGDGLATVGNKRAS